MCFRAQLPATLGESGVALVRRFAARRDSRDRVWRVSRKVALFVSQVLLAQTLTQPAADHVRLVASSDAIRPGGGTVWSGYSRHDLTSGWIKRGST